MGNNIIDYFVFLFIPILAGKIGGIEKALDLGYQEQLFFRRIC